MEIFDLVEIGDLKVALAQEVVKATVNSQQPMFEPGQSLGVPLHQALPLSSLML